MDVNSSTKPADERQRLTGLFIHEIGSGLTSLPCTARNVTSSTGEIKRVGEPLEETDTDSRPSTMKDHIPETYFCGFTVLETLPSLVVIETVAANG